MGAVVGLFPPGRQERARQEARVSSASGEVRLPPDGGPRGDHQGYEQADEEVYAPAKDDPCDYLSAGDESPGSTSGPDDEDEPAFGRPALLAKTTLPERWEWT